MILYFSECINRYFITDDDNRIVQVGERAFYMNKAELVRNYCRKNDIMTKIDMVDGITKNPLFRFTETDQLLTEFAEYLI